MWDGSGWADAGADIPVTGGKVVPVGPPPRSFPAMAEDAADNVVFFGGYGHAGGPGDVIGADNADRADTWTLVTPATAGSTPNAAEQVRVKLEPAEIAADGTATSRATATVTQGGVALAGQQVDFTTDGDVTFSKTRGITDASGSFTTTITASKTPDSERITATASTAGGDPVHPGAGVTGSAVLLERGLTLTLDPSYVPPDGSSTTQATATLSQGGSLADEKVCFKTDGDVTFSTPGPSHCGVRTGTHRWTVKITASRTPGPEKITATTANSGLSASAILYEGGAQWIDHTAAASGPTPGRDEAAMAYDAANHQTVLFGGFDNSDGGNHRLGDTWTWDGSHWTRQTPKHSPPARYGHAMAYDASSGQVVLFGGRAGSGYLGDTWTWDGKAKDWTERHPDKAPSPRYMANMAADGTGVVLFSGTNGQAYDDTGPTDPNGPGHLADTWTWAHGAWTEHHPVTTPPGRGRAAIAYHAPTGKVVLYGGTQEFYFGFHPMADTWTWDGTTWAQEGAGTNPGPRFSAAMAYDSVGRQLVLFGGSNEHSDPGGVLGDSWTWDGGAWARQSPPFSPRARESAAMAQDPSGRVVLATGFVPNGSGGGSYLADTWTWDAAVSLRLTPRALAADGSSTSEAVATVTDPKGRPVKGLSDVSFTTDGDVRFSAVKDRGNGTYAATITASTTGDIETVTVHTPSGDSAATLNEVGRECSLPLASSGPGSWSAVAQMPFPVSRAAAAAGADGHIYAFGGRNNLVGVFSTVEEYDPCGNSWQTLPSMPGGTRQNAAATAGPDGRIYVAGGHFEEFILSASDVVEVYTPGVGATPGHWDTLPPLHTARAHDGAAFGPDGRLYVSGGTRAYNFYFDPSTPLDSVEAYSFQTRAWSPVEAMSTPRQGLASLPGPDGRVFAIGGRNSASATLNSAEAYTKANNATTGTWLPVAPMSNARAFFAAATGSDGLLYATGGSTTALFFDSGVHPLNTVEAYDGCTNAWDPVTPMPTARAVHAAATGPDGRLYVLGGETASTTSTPLDPFGSLSSMQTASVLAYTPDPKTSPCSLLGVADKPEVSIDDAPAVTEPASGSAPATFTVTLREHPGALVAGSPPFRVDYQSVDGSAKAGRDYQAASGTLVFARGETTKKVTVPVLADKDPGEPTEHFTVKLSNDSKTTIARGEGTATINDPPEQPKPPPPPKPPKPPPTHPPPSPSTPPSGSASQPAGAAPALAAPLAPSPSAGLHPGASPGSAAGPGASPGAGARPVGASPAPSQSLPPPSTVTSAQAQAQSQSQAQSQAQAQAQAQGQAQGQAQAQQQAQSQKQAQSQAQSQTQAQAQAALMREREREGQAQLEFEHADGRRGPDPAGTALYAVGLLASSFTLGMALARRLRRRAAPVRVHSMAPRGPAPRRRRRRR